MVEARKIVGSFTTGLIGLVLLIYANLGVGRGEKFPDSSRATLASLARALNIAPWYRGSGIESSAADAEFTGLPSPLYAENAAYLLDE